MTMKMTSSFYSVFFIAMLHVTMFLIASMAKSGQDLLTYLFIYLFIS